MECTDISNFNFKDFGQTLGDGKNWVKNLKLKQEIL